MSSSQRSIGRRLTLAVTFLTGIPLPVRGEVAAADLSGSVGWYPLVGLGLGLAAWGAYAGLVSLLPPLVAAVLVLLLLELATRGLHMDGFMDTCDGVFSAAPRERALEIMKDSSAGPMGVAGAIFIVLLKAAALSALTRTAAAAPLLAGWAAARALPAVNMYFWPYARSSGTGEAFTRERSRGSLVLAGVFLALAVVVAGFVAGSGFVGGFGFVAGPGGWAAALRGWAAGLIVVVVAGAVALLAQAAVAKRLGGLTGDVYGFGIELAEAAALVAGCALVW